MNAFLATFSGVWFFIFMMLLPSIVDGLFWEEYSLGVAIVRALFWPIPFIKFVFVVLKDMVLE